MHELRRDRADRTPCFGVAIVPDTPFLVASVVMTLGESSYLCVDVSDAWALEIRRLRANCIGKRLSFYAGPHSRVPK